MVRSGWLAAVVLGGCLVQFPLPEEQGTTGGSSAAPGTTTGETSTTTGLLTTDGGETEAIDTGDTPDESKWIRTAAIVGRSTSRNVPGPEEAARFDLLVATPEQQTTWAGDAADTWSNLRALNPDIRLFVAVESAANYAPYEGFGDGWDFIVENHGIGTADRWTAVGVDHPTSYLQWSTHWAMSLQASTWRAYWSQSVHAGLVEQLGRDALSRIDGVYIVANDGYRYAHYDSWEVEVSPGVFEPDFPADYHDGTAWNDALLQEHFDLYLDGAIAFFGDADPPLEVAVGFSGLHETEHWTRLDARAQPVAFAFTNAGLVQQWGATYNVTHFATKLGQIQNLSRTGLMHGNQGAASEIAGEGLAKMDAMALTGPGEGATQMSGWEALWFSICGHMAAIDPARDDQYFYFSVWGHSEFHWFAEYDPEFLHLGAPIGEAFELDGATMREFDDGWVVLNGTQADLVEVRVPSGMARVIDHDALETPGDRPLVATFDLPLHRGLILLRDGAMLGR